MKICKVEGCSNKHLAKGYCAKHYRQMRVYGKITSVGRTIYDPNEIIIHDDYAELLLYNRKCEEIGRSILDLDDVDKIKEYKWRLISSGYVTTEINKKIILLHRLITNCPDNMCVDHIDRNPLNNRKNNLRICTPQENNFNKGLIKTNTSGATGVSWCNRESKWRARIQINSKEIHLGMFENKKDAIEARKRAEIKYFGEYRNKENK